MWRESFSYDLNGNRAGKSTPWGVIRYEYDAENRLLRRGDVVFTNDRDGNTLGEVGLRHEARYEYNGQNRMIYSEITNRAERTQTVTFYAYDAFGRRSLTENVTGQVIRTVYDGFSFDVIREGEAFRDGSLTTRFSDSVTTTGTSTSTQRYRWAGSVKQVEGGEAGDGYTLPTQGSRFDVRGVTLYAGGEAVAVRYSSSTSTRSLYLGKDIMGSVRTATADTGRLEDRFEYDVFGTPVSGDLSGGMNLGYMSKPFDSATGFYNYGFRDYRPVAARFTTVDPIRDGNNWFLYVNNDPVNYIDMWGLCKAEVRASNTTNVAQNVIGNIVNIANNPAVGAVLSSAKDMFQSVGQSSVSKAVGRVGNAASVISIVSNSINVYHVMKDPKSNNLDRGIAIFDFGTSLIGAAGISGAVASMYLSGAKKGALKGGEFVSDFNTRTLHYIDGMYSWATSGWYSIFGY
jgi:RHS repeat-associated protein